jgi:hypothetical protein
MLSAAKHLLFHIENKQSRPFAGAQDDIDRGFFISLPGVEEACGVWGSGSKL